MLRVFRHNASAGANEGLWSFSYIDWMGRVQTGIGTASRTETTQLAERVQAEHHSLRKHRRAAVAGEEHDGGPAIPKSPESTAARAASAAAELRVYSKDTPEPSTRTGEVDDTPVVMRIGERMVQDGLISEDDLQRALAHQEANGGRIVEVLISKKVITPEQYLHFMGKQNGTPFIDLENCDIPKPVIKLIPAHLAKQFEVIPIDSIGKMLSVAMVCPIDKSALSNLQGHTGLTVRPMLCSQIGFKNALVRHYG